MAKVSLMFPISEEQKSAVEAFAIKADKSTAQVIREAIAKYIGYDLSAEPPTKRPTKWASKEERTLHQRAMNKARQKRNAEVVRLMSSGNTAEAKALANKPLEAAEYTPKNATVQVDEPSLANPTPASLDLVMVALGEDEDEGEE